MILRVRCCSADLIKDAWDIFNFYGERVRLKLSFIVGGLQDITDIPHTCMPQCSIKAAVKQHKLLQTRELHTLKSSFLYAGQVLQLCTCCSPYLGLHCW